MDMIFCGLQKPSVICRHICQDSCDDRKNESGKKVAEYVKENVGKQVIHSKPRSRKTGDMPQARRSYRHPSHRWLRVLDAVRGDEPPFETHPAASRATPPLYLITLWSYVYTYDPGFCAMAPGWKHLIYRVKMETVGRNMGTPDSDGRRLRLLTFGKQLSPVPPNARVMDRGVAVIFSLNALPRECSYDFCTFKSLSGGCIASLVIWRRAKRGTLSTMHIINDMYKHPNLMRLLYSGEDARRLHENLCVISDGLAVV
jgi:hypothetical protein